MTISFDHKFQEQDYISGIRFEDYGNSKSITFVGVWKNSVYEILDSLNKFCVNSLPAFLAESHKHFAEVTQSNINPGIIRLEVFPALSDDERKDIAITIAEYLSEDNFIAPSDVRRLQMQLGIIKMPKPQLWELAI